MIITIDGPVATGKSTIAKKLAESIGFIYFDTGAMYRTLTYGLLKYQINPENHEELETFLKKFTFDIKLANKNRQYFFEKENITHQIRSEEVTEAVSIFAALPAIREKLVKFQHEYATGVNAVFEGRDMGTVVFPEAQVKIFLTGRADVRARRRYEEFIAKYPEKNLTLEKCLEDINRRDLFDSTRDISPLVQAEDAYVIDTSDLTISEIVYKILEYKDSLKTKKSSQA